LLLLLAVYLILAVKRRTPMHIGGWEFSLPHIRMALAQTALSCLDWVIAGAVLYVLLQPDAVPPFTQFLGVFMLAQVAGFVSHVPGGLGVFESVILASLSDGGGGAAVFGSLVVYRCVYYLLPFLIGTALMGAYELLRRRESMRRAARAAGTW